MSIPLLLAALWVIAATFVAFLPMKYQRIVGLPLLIAALGLIVWIGVAHGSFLAVLALAAFASMFRKPLSYFWRKAMGKTTETTSKPPPKSPPKPPHTPRIDPPEDPT